MGIDILVHLGKQNFRVKVLWVYSHLKSVFLKTKSYLTDDILIGSDFKSFKSRLKTLRDVYSDNLIDFAFYKSLVGTHLDLKLFILKKQYHFHLLLG